MKEGYLYLTKITNDENSYNCTEGITNRVLLRQNDNSKDLASPSLRFEFCMILKI